MVPSLLFSSLSRARSYSCSYSTTAGIAAAPREGLHPPASDDHHHDKKQTHTTISVGQSPTCLMTRTGRGQWPSSSDKMAVVDHNGWALAPRVLAMVTIPSHHEQGQGDLCDQR
jgi:hypothetical protein